MSDCTLHLPVSYGEGQDHGTEEAGMILIHYVVRMAVDLFL